MIEKYSSESDCVLDPFSGGSTSLIQARLTPKNQRPGYENKTKPMFISAMTGSDNENSYTYLGQVWKNPKGFTWAVGAKSPISEDAPTQKAIAWLLKHIKANRMLPDGAEFWHEGRCGICNRKLTVPESIASGIGPICAGGRK